MNRFCSGALLAGAAMLVSAAAFADSDTTLSATYDSFLQNTVFTITNNSTQTDSSITLTTNFGPTFAVTIDDLAAGATDVFAFNQPNGGFEVDPAGAGVPDNTLYQFSLVQSGITLTSAWFSTSNNLTGNYVDFLGNTCFGFGGCAVAQSGVVAAVPEPASLAVLAIGLVGVGAAARRRRAV